MSLLKRKNLRVFGRQIKDSGHVDNCTSTDLPSNISSEEIAPVAEVSSARAMPIEVAFSSVRAPKLGNLSACVHCGRQFNKDSLEKHEKICVKVFSNKRTIFNSAKQRANATSGLMVAVL